ncbi:Bifunctional protein PyrR [Corynebacterium afermentans subsp. afermentans]|uniref:Bifunctional protein PyrR n=2 Tax=Corynebacterium TaxID=1716 RepID=A0A9X8NA77_9CORY|nr:MULTISPECIES: bifunctional pyr operon transcriptional regulator/uracil phosphoribosyltransferase PyrR [Corynebacterium]MCG7273173.1 bifunctional pyr operon transcriptional regulator/uracil phosphoribosyltransferase PyrR [Corynebacterium afermentans]MCG7291804.1 bifunctional pyr operon transcriptional regulator/uracil phosphoribosyltransferase PyrR [Corynebacterium afermentans]MDC7108222.1 bifunctional pyr operon transcriptional regulator/uracil phosphoribosyltransferase PyrR [Corynebacterium 
MSENERSTVELLNAQDVGRTVARIAHQIIEKTALDDETSPQVLLLGIPSGGVPLAQRIAVAVEEFSGVAIPVGSLDTTLYRDDLRNRPHRALRPTNIPVDIDGAVVILVDDVLYSGRTIRAALDSLRDIGRPAAIQLAVLVDRGHRELPIRADYVGKNIPTSKDEDVTVSLTPLDAEDRVTLSRPAEGGTK